MKPSSHQYKQIRERETPPKTQSSNKVNDLKKTQLKTGTITVENDEDISMMGNNIINAMKTVNKEMMDMTANSMVYNIKQYIEDEKKKVQSKNKQFLEVLEKKRQKMEEESKKILEKKDKNQHKLHQKLSESMKNLQEKYEKTLKQNEELNKRLRTDPLRKQLQQSKEMSELLKVKVQKYQKQIGNLKKSVNEMATSSNKLNKIFMEKCKEHEQLILKYNQQCVKRIKVEKQRSQFKKKEEELRKQIILNLQIPSIQNEDTLMLLSSCFENTSKATIILEPLINKILETMPKKQDERTSQQISEFKQLSFHLNSLTKMPDRLIVLLSKLVNKLISQIDFQKIYTKEVLKYTNLLETNFAILNQISNETIETGLYRALIQIVDYNKNSSKVNELMGNTVKNMADFGKKLNSKIQEISKITKEKEGYQVQITEQKQSIKKIEENLSQVKNNLSKIEQKLQNQQRQAKQSMQKMEKNLKTKITQLEEQLVKTKSLNKQLNTFVTNGQNDRKQLAQKLKAEEEKYLKVKKLMETIGGNQKI